MNETEKFWSGEFGDQYNERNQGLVEQKTAFLAKALERAYGINSSLELGCGTGQNMLALSRLIPNITPMGIEINKQAADQCPVGVVFNGALSSYTPNEYVYADLTMSMGFLIHIPPQDLFHAYDVLFEASNKYILIAEYYSPKPRSIPYRGHMDKLWARDFAGELMDLHPLHLVDYGFVYHRSALSQLDDLTYFLLAK